MFLAMQQGFSGCSGPVRDVQRSQTRLDLAKELLAKGQDGAAETEAKKALVYDARNEEAENLLGLVFVVRAERHVSLIEKEDCLTGIEADALRLEADEGMRRAGAHFARAVELAPDYGEAWQNRAVAAMYFRDWDKAVDYTRLALANLARLASESLARANLGWAYFHRQDYVHAATELLQAVQRQPNFCLGSYRLSTVLFERKEYRNVIDRLASFGDNPKLCPLQEVFYLGGQTYLRVHDTESAMRSFETCVGMAPKSCQARQCQKALAELTP
jgi:Tfp pilus assembly protein PilF